MKEPEIPETPEPAQVQDKKAWYGFGVCPSLIVCFLVMHAKLSLMLGLLHPSRNGMMFNATPFHLVSIIDISDMLMPDRCSWLI